jgi:hypothetical protein
MVKQQSRVTLSCAGVVTRAKNAANVSRTKQTATGKECLDSKVALLGGEIRLSVTRERIH